MPNHLTPEELSREFGIERAEVIRICVEEHVPVYHGRIDKTLFEAVRLIHRSRAGARHQLRPDRRRAPRRPVAPARARSAQAGTLAGCASAPGVRSCSSSWRWPCPRRMRERRPLQPARASSAALLELFATDAALARARSGRAGGARARLARVRGDLRRRARAPAASRAATSARRSARSRSGSTRSTARTRSTRSACCSRRARSRDDQRRPRPARPPLARRTARSCARRAAGARRCRGSSRALRAAEGRARAERARLGGARRRARRAPTARSARCSRACGAQHVRVAAALADRRRDVPCGARTRRAPAAARRRQRRAPATAAPRPPPPRRRRCPPPPGQPSLAPGTTLSVAATAYSLPGPHRQRPAGRRWASAPPIPRVIPLGTRFDVPGYGTLRGRRHGLGRRRRDDRRLDAGRASGGVREADHYHHVPLMRRSAPPPARALPASHRARPGLDRRGAATACRTPRSRAASRRRSRAHGLGGSGTGVAVADLATGEIIYRRNGWRPLAARPRPRSSTRRSARSARCGPTSASRRRSPAPARARARPGTATSTSSARATRRSRATASQRSRRRCRARGIRTISGRIRGDETIFDASRWGPWPLKLHRRRVAAALGPRARPRRHARAATRSPVRRAARRAHSATRARGRGRAGRRALRRRRPGTQGRARARAHAVRSRSGGSCASWTATATTSRPRWSRRRSAHYAGGNGTTERGMHVAGEVAAADARRRTPRSCTSPTARGSRTRTARRRARSLACSRAPRPTRRSRSRSPARSASMGAERHARAPPARAARPRARQERHARRRLGARRLRHGRERAALRVRGADQRAAG